jgi:hypothetical protein
MTRTYIDWLCVALSSQESCAVHHIWSLVINLWFRRPDHHSTWRVQAPGACWLVTA